MPTLEAVRDIVSEEIAKKVPDKGLEALELKVVQLDAKLVLLADAYGTPRGEALFEEVFAMKLQLQESNERVSALQRELRQWMCRLDHLFAQQPQAPQGAEALDKIMIADLEKRVRSCEHTISQFASGQVKIDLRLDAFDKYISDAAAVHADEEANRLKDVAVQVHESAINVNLATTGHVMEHDLNQQLGDLVKRLQVIEERLDERNIESPTFTKAAKDNLSMTSNAESTMDGLDGQKMQMLVQPSSVRTEDRDARFAEVQEKEPNRLSPIPDRNMAGHRAIADHILRHRLQYFFQASTWDMMVFYNLGVMNLADTILNSITVVATIMTQLVFILIVARSMTNNPLTVDSIRELERWRLFTAHRVEYYDSVSASSMAARVCGGSLALAISSSQSELYSSIHDFLGREQEGSWIRNISMFDSLNGKVLSLLCFFLWTLSCFMEFKKIITYPLALSQRVGAQSILMEDGMDLEITEISAKRFLFVLIFNSGPRLIMIFALYSWGSMFLLYTIELSELILNALALNFVTDIDDQIFFLFGTASAKAIQGHVRAIPFGMITRDQYLHKFVDGHSCLTMLVVLAMLIIVWVTTLEPLSWNMERAHDVLCGGNLNFVEAEDPGTNVLYYYNTHDYVEGMSLADTLQGTKLYRFEALSRLTDYKEIGRDAEKDDYGHEVLTVDTVKNLVSLSAQSAIDGMDCTNVLDRIPSANQRAWGVALKFEIGLATVYTKCKDLRYLCPNHQSVRAMCAIECDCSNVTSGLYDLAGCSSQCSTERLQKIDAAAVHVLLPSGAYSSNCPDGDTAYKTNFRLFYNGYETYLNSSGTLNTVRSQLGMLSNQSLADKAWVEGCNLTATIKSQRIIPSPCDTSKAYLGSVAAFCPDSCATYCSPAPAPQPPAPHQGPPNQPIGALLP